MSTGRGGVRARSLVLGHGAGGGVEAPDLKLLASTLPRGGCVGGPVRAALAGRGSSHRVAGTTLDGAWCDAVTSGLTLGDRVVPLLVGGRSAGARVACRTAVDLGAAVWSRSRSRFTRQADLTGRGPMSCQPLPVLVVQGDRDAFGDADEVERLGRRPARQWCRCRARTTRSGSLRRGPITQTRGRRDA